MTPRPAPQQAKRKRSRVRQRSHEDARNEPRHARTAGPPRPRGDSAPSARAAGQRASSLSLAAAFAAPLQREPCELRVLHKGSQGSQGSHEASRQSGHSPPHPQGAAASAGRCPCLCSGQAPLDAGYCGSFCCKPSARVATSSFRPAAAAEDAPLVCGDATLLALGWSRVSDPPPDADDWDDLLHAWGLRDARQEEPAAVAGDSLEAAVEEGLHTHSRLLEHEDRSTSSSTAAPAAARASTSGGGGDRLPASLGKQPSALAAALEAVLRGAGAAATG